MSEDLPPRTEAEEALEVYDHSMSPGIKAASIASFFFFAGGRSSRGTTVVHWPSGGSQY